MTEYCVDMAIYIKARNCEEAQEIINTILERGAYELQIFPEYTEVLNIEEVHLD